MSVVRRRTMVETAVSAAEPSVDTGIQTVEAGASRPTIAQMRDAEDALGVNRDTYTPLAAVQAMLPRIRMRPGQAQAGDDGVESDFDDFGRPVALSHAEPPLLGPMAGDGAGPSCVAGPWVARDFRR